MIKQLSISIPLPWYLNLTFHAGFNLNDFTVLRVVVLDNSESYLRGAPILIIVELNVFGLRLGVFLTQY